jgi:hypothetical protein
VLGRSGRDGGCGEAAETDEVPSGVVMAEDATDSTGAARPSI